MYMVDDKSKLLNHINHTRKEFESGFLEGNYYNKQTRDENHREQIIESLNIKRGSKILDLGTGNGFMAFAIAARNPSTTVVGLDILEDTLRRNEAKARELELFHLNFVTYDGMNFPFEEDYFDVVVCRYAFHHFPDIEHSFREIGRVLKSGGQLFISDPCPNKEDSARFIDEFMKIKQDGHVKCYTHDELYNIAQRHYLIENACFKTSLRFARKNPERYRTVLENFNEKVLEGYGVEEINQEIYITEAVNNISFLNCKGLF